MPVNSNIAVGTAGTVAWDGTTARHMDIRKYNRFAWSFEITETLVADVTFNVQAAPASDADPCVPGTFAAVPEVATCDGTIEGGPQASITFPAGTAAGTICGGTIPCRPGAFVRLAAAAGNTAADNARIRAVGLRQGPRIA